MQNFVNNTKTLKLDSSYRPIEVVDSLEALVLCLVGKAYAVETYAKEIRSVSKSFSLPAVIVLTRYVRFKFKAIPCSRKNVIWRDKSQCQYCAKIFDKDSLTIDHVLPRSKGGGNTWTNLVAACKKCNQKKGDRTPEQANMDLLRVPAAPKTNVLLSLGSEPISHLWKDYLWE